MRRRCRTKPFRDDAGRIVAGSIAEAGYIDLGGVPQYVLIRGTNTENPLLIVLHGGPGFSDTTFLRRFNAELEKSFTLVYWDQRGTGKSYDEAIPVSSMNVERFIGDLDELIDASVERVRTDRVVLFGHSWGSALGVLYASRNPTKVDAYVGSGQLGDGPAAEAASYAYALAEAERVGAGKIVDKLRAIGPPPYGADALWIERLSLNRLEGTLRPKALFGLARVYLGAPEFSLFELPRLMRGFRFSIDAMFDETSRIDLTRLAPALEIPVFFFLGRNDHWVPPETSEAYFDALVAPSKRLVWFEKSGHEPFVDEPEKFNALMEELVRPAVSGAALSRSERRPVFPAAAGARDR